jgi:hypothetical protein
MALDTYGGLKTSIASWLARADLTTMIPDFVTLAHKQLMRDLRGHLRLQKRDPTFQISAEYMQAPADFLEFVSGYLNTSPKRTLTFMPNDTQTDLFGSGSDYPAYFCLVGSAENAENFRFGPVPSGTFTATISYYAKMPFFTSDADYNWILTDYPGLYLYGSLMQAAAFIQQDERISLWAKGYGDDLGNCMAAGRRARWGGNGMAVRVA